MNKVAKGAVIATAVAGLFCARAAMAADTMGGGDAKNVKCEGGNSCKAQGACGGAGHDCAGKNECKGKGWVMLPEADCKAKGGTPK